MLVDKIIDFENNFAEIQSNVLGKTYGKIFFDKNNPLSHDSNHAFIYEDANYGFAVNDIVNFYHSLDITPRVYTFTRNKSTIGQYLERKGFKKSIDEICFYVQKNKIIMDIPETIEIKRLNRVDETISELLDSDQEQGEWGLKLF